MRELKWIAPEIKELLNHKKGADETEENKHMSLSEIWLEGIALELLIKYSLARRKIIEMSSTDEDFAEMELERELEEYERKIKEASD